MVKKKTPKQTTVSSLLQRACEQEECKGNSEGVHTFVQRAPWNRVCCRILKLTTSGFSAKQLDATKVPQTPIGEDATVVTQNFVGQDMETFEQTCHQNNEQNEISWGVVGLWVSVFVFSFASAFSVMK